MADVSDVVKVRITRDTTAVARASFGIPLLVGEFADNKLGSSFGRAQSYSSLAEMYDAGWGTGDNLYKMAKAIFSQSPKVSKIVVGRKDSGDSDWEETLIRISTADNTWYTLLVDTNADQDILNVAAYIEAVKKMYFAQVTDSDIVSAGDTDVAHALKVLGYDRTVLIYHANAKHDEHAGAAWVGEGLPWDIGSSTWAYKTLKGVTADTLTSAQEGFALGKNCNIYTTTAGVSITREGKAVSGEYIDIVMGLDYLESRLQENVYQAIVGNRKVPYDDGGITAIGGIVQATLNEAATKGILQADSIEVTVPLYKDIEQADRINRKLPDVKFSAVLQGAIHTVTIDGTVSV